MAMLTSPHAKLIVGKYVYKLSLVMETRMVFEKKPTGGILPSSSMKFFFVVRDDPAPFFESFADFSTLGIFRRTAEYATAHHMAGTMSDGQPRNIVANMDSQGRAGLFVDGEPLGFSSMNTMRDVMDVVLEPDLLALLMVFSQESLWKPLKRTARKGPGAVHQMVGELMPQFEAARPLAEKEVKRRRWLRDAGDRPI